MQIKSLYRYVDGRNVTITPNKRNDTDNSHMYRCIADTGKMLSNGTNTANVIDTINVSEWYEIDYHEESANTFITNN